VGSSSPKQQVDPFLVDEQVSKRLCIILPRVNLTDISNMPSSPVVKFMPEPPAFRKSSASTSQKQQQTEPPSPVGARMEITVQSLFGIACNDEGRKATVAFSGSVRDMQVGSSIFDPVQGKLVVESMPLPPGRTEVHWPRDQPPHLTVNIDERQALDAKTNLQKANRDSEIVSKETVEEAYRFSRLNSSKSAGATVFWSDSTIPDIVEMTLRFGSFHGVSYLVFFGHRDDLGTCVMDLPVRKLQQDDTCSDLSEDARIRVKVSVIIDEKDSDDSKLPPMASVSTSSSCEDSILKKIPFSRTYLEGQIAPLMAVIRHNEEDAHRERYFTKHNVNVEVPQHFDHEEATATPTLSPVGFCSLGIWEQLRHSVAACSGSMDPNDFYNENIDSSGDSSTVGMSTIATRESWDL